jgi:hypothetical protein
MKIRSILILATLAVILAACTAVSPVSSPSGDPTGSPSPSVSPSDPPEQTPSGEPEVVGTVTILPAAVDGPGETLAAALNGDLAQPMFIRGYVFKDSDGQVYFADEMTDESAPAFSNPRVLVANYPSDGPTWDIGNAGTTGLQETNGILFYENAAIYGTLSE